MYCARRNWVDGLLKTMKAIQRVESNDEASRELQQPMISNVKNAKKKNIEKENTQQKFSFRTIENNLDHLLTRYFGLTTKLSLNKKQNRCFPYKKKRIHSQQYYYNTQHKKPIQVHAETKVPLVNMVILMDVSIVSSSSSSRKNTTTAHHPNQFSAFSLCSADGIHRKPFNE